MSETTATPPAESQAQRLHRIYDDENCPRNDGGRLRRQDGGDYMAKDPRDPMSSRYHFECSNCGKWWKPIELSRRVNDV